MKRSAVYFSLLALALLTGCWELPNPVAVVAADEATDSGVGPAEQLVQGAAPATPAVRTPLWALVKGEEKDDSVIDEVGQVIFRASRSSMLNVSLTWTRSTVEDPRVVVPLNYAVRLVVLSETTGDVLYSQQVADLPATSVPTSTADGAVAVMPGWDDNGDGEILVKAEVVYVPTPGGPVAVRGLPYTEEVEVGLPGGA